MSEDLVHRANRWQGFYLEDGGVKQVLDTIRKAYFDRAADLMPNDTSALLKLGMAGKIVDQIEAHVLHIVNTGKIEAASREHAERIASLPEAARRRF